MPELGIPADLATYMPDLPERLGWSHLVIARAGASTIAELTAAGRPAILVPLPSATDDHQTANAREMARAGGARMIRAAAASPPVELAKQMQKLGLEPGALANAAAAGAKAAAGPTRRRISPIWSSGPGAIPAPIRKSCATNVLRPMPRGGAGMKGVGHRHRHDPFRRHRRHRHVRHRRGDEILGYSVQGSDIAEGYVVEGLREHGIPVAIGHSAGQSGRRGGGRDLDRGQARPIPEVGRGL